MKNFAIAVSSYPGQQQSNGRPNETQKKALKTVKLWNAGESNQTLGGAAFTVPQSDPEMKVPMPPDLQSIHEQWLAVSPQAVESAAAELGAGFSAPHAKALAGRSVAKDRAIERFVRP